MILTGPGIAESRGRGEVTIEPFDPGRVSPNAYDYRLDPHLRVTTGSLDSARPSVFTEHRIEASGFLLRPGTLYLGLTHERTGSTRYAQFINGDRSTGSLGIWVHVAAPLGHAGHAIRWTLEITVVRPVVVYPLMTFGKIVFLDMHGAPADYRRTDPKYGDDRIESSRLFEEAGAWSR